MLPRLLFAAFLLAHGAIHASFLAPRPPATAGGPTWSFEIARSWVLTPLGIQPATMRLLAIALVAAAIAAFALAALAAAGVIPVELWGPASMAGAVASVALLVLFFQPWLVLGVVIDLGLLWQSSSLAGAPTAAQSRDQSAASCKEVGIMKRLFAVATSMLLAFLVFSPVVFAADPSLPHNGRVLISTGGDVTVPAGDHADAVIVVKGTATIGGEVNTIVVVDGAANLTGARTESVIAVRSPVTIGPGTVVLGDVMKVDSVVTRVGDGAIGGTVRDLAADIAGIGWFVGPAMIMAYLGFALAAIAAGLLLAGLAARQVRAAEALISHQPVNTLVAALAGVFLPIFLVAMLVVTIVGAPLGIGILVGAWPLAAFVGYLVAGIWIGDWVLARMTPGTTRERPYLAAIVGSIILELVGILPFLPMIATLFGFGAVLLLAWRTLRAGSMPTAPVHQPAPVPSAS